MGGGGTWKEEGRLCTNPTCSVPQITVLVPVQKKKEGKRGGNREKTV